jgi:uncharacterized membrane protein
MSRAAVKTCTFAVLHFGVAFGVVYALTGSVVVATGAGLIEPLVNTVAFYFHEKFWNGIEGHRFSLPWSAKPLLALKPTPANVL